eukprot:1452512-Pleurochrysis_carterae.AAC.1
MHVSNSYAPLRHSVDSTDGGTTGHSVVKVGGARMDVMCAAAIDDKRDMFGVRRQVPCVSSG